MRPTFNLFSFLFISLLQFYPLKTERTYILLSLSPIQVHNFKLEETERIFQFHTFTFQVVQFAAGENGKDFETYFSVSHFHKLNFTFSSWRRQKGCWDIFFSFTLSQTKFHNLQLEKTERMLRHMDEKDFWLPRFHPHHKLNDNFWQQD